MFHTQHTAPPDISHAWVDPLSMAKTLSVSEPFLALLYSGMQATHTGRYSLLGYHARRHCKQGSLQHLREQWCTPNSCRPTDMWFGYMGYQLKYANEQLPADLPGSLQFPECWWVQYEVVLVFDHDEKKVRGWCHSEERIPEVKRQLASCMPYSYAPVQAEMLTSPMSNAEYLHNVEKIREAIARGEVYQANLTRKFHVTLSQAFEAFDLFAALSKESPAPYSAFLRFDERYVVSSSPEQFLAIDENGRVTSRPIKGSAPRDPDPEKDSYIKQALEQSVKNRAENLMIVDLMRNDLARSCVPGSVHVSELCQLTSYATVHHLSTCIAGQKYQKLHPLDLILAAFPPGSMTGAPKLKAMELCTMLERYARGVYSGALGWLGPDGTCELSVVIRTMLIEGNRCEFQAGGGIIYDSVPEEEWHELLAKLAAIRRVLHVPETAFWQL